MPAHGRAGRHPPPCPTPEAFPPPARRSTAHDPIIARDPWHLHERYSRFYKIYPAGALHPGNPPESYSLDDSSRTAILSADPSAIGIPPQEFPPSLPPDAADLFRTPHSLML